MRENSLQEGRRQGREECKKESKLEIARKMKNRKIPIRDIVELTGLTAEEIAQL